MQLNSKLVDIKIGNNRLFVKYALDFESDGSTEGHASGSTESKGYFILCVVIGSHMISRSERHREGGLSLATNFLDGQAEDVDWKFIGRLLIGESESAASLPRPVGVIEDLELDSL